MIILAKAVKGKEFLYSAKSAHEVSKAKADSIQETLNAIGWQLKDGEVWHKYEIDEFDYAPFGYASYQSFKVYRGTLKEVKR